MSESTIKFEQPTMPEVQELLRRATPGPWRVRVGDEGWMHIVGPDAQDVTDIGDMEDITTEDAWNGKLIAAAPDLARLAISLDAQLQQEREALERSQAALRAWWAIHNPETAKPQSIGWHNDQVFRAELMTSVALARPAQAQAAGEGL